MSPKQTNLLQGTLDLLILKAVGGGELHCLGISRRIEHITQGTFLVKPGSLIKAEDDKLSFLITDGAHDVAVSYQGQVPDLFREGQGVVAEGVLEAPGKLHADTILAKHDERYMPREVVDALKKQGRWQEGGGGS